MITDGACFKKAAGVDGDGVREGKGKEKCRVLCVSTKEREEARGKREQEEGWVKKKAIQAESVNGLRSD